MNRKRAPLFILTLFFLNACGGGGGSSSGGGGGTGPQPIAVNFQTAPPQAVTAGGNFSVSATVTNDSANAGVTWNCAPAGSCGTFSANSTPSGTATTYTAPSAPPTGGTVTITAASVTDTTKNAQGVTTVNAVTISLSTSPTPLAAMTVSSSATLSATTNDTKGVTWSCMPAGGCGTFSMASTSNGQSTTYTAPGSTGTVTLIATSITDNAISQQVNVTINPPITVSISTPPPGTLATSGAATVAATTNDAAGVTWSCTPTGSCGSFNPPSTASTVTTTYTAPATGAQVTIIATSVTDTTKSATASVVVSGTASVATLKGQYAFLVRSPTGERGTATWAGSVNLDGKGNVLGGIEDVVAPGRVDPADPILETGPGSSSAYTVDASGSGHGTLTMSTQLGELLQISFVLTSATHAEVIEVDGYPGSGTMDLQNPSTSGFSSSQISGPYSFTTTGINAGTSPQPEMSIGGVFSVTGTSVQGTLDINTASAFTSVSFTNANALMCLPASTPCPDVNGRGALNFVPGGTQSTRTFIYYIVSSKVLRLLEFDGISYMGGSAYAQGSPSATLSGNYVYAHSGWKPAGVVTPTGRAVAAGEFAAISAGTTGTISGGISDANTGAAAPTTPSAGVGVSGSYTASTTEAGTLSLTLTDAAGNSNLNAYVVDPTINILDPNNPSGGGGALLLHTDTNINGTGVLIPQQTSAPFIGSYAVNLTNSIAASTQNELDLVGVLTSDGTSMFGGTDNLADYLENSTFSSTTMVNAPISGTFVVDANHSGRFTGSFTVTEPLSGYPFIPNSTTPFTVIMYQASPSQAFVVESDNLAIVTGRLLQQALP